MDISTQTQPVVLPEALEKFLDGLMVAKGFAGTMSADFIEESKAELRPLLLKKINYALFGNLSAADKQAFEQLVDQNPDPDTLNNFFIEHLPAINQIVADALLTFRNTYLG